MNTPKAILYKYSPETIEAAESLPKATISEYAHKHGMQHGETLILCMDSLLKYAQAYKQRFDGDLAGDNYLGEAWKDAAVSLRKLLNGDGQVAMAKGITTDSKDNGCIEKLFWHAIAAAGFEEKELGL